MFRVPRSAQTGQPPLSAKISSHPHPLVECIHHLFLLLKVVGESSKSVHREDGPQQSVPGAHGPYRAQAYGRTRSHAAWFCGAPISVCRDVTHDASQLFRPSLRVEALRFIPSHLIPPHLIPIPRGRLRARLSFLFPLRFRFLSGARPRSRRLRTPFARRASQPTAPPSTPRRSTCSPSVCPTR